MYKKRNGFTLIELMIAIAIIALLAAVAMPKFAGVTEDAKAAAVKGNVAVLRTSINMFYIRHGVYPTCAAGVRNNIRSGNVIQNIMTTNTVNGFFLFTYYSRNRTPDTPRGIRVQPAANAVLNRVVAQGGTGTFPAVANNSYGWRYRARTGEIHANLNATAYGQTTPWNRQ